MLFNRGGFTGKRRDLPYQIYRFLLCQGRGRGFVRAYPAQIDFIGLYGKRCARRKNQNRCSE